MVRAIHFQEGDGRVGLEHIPSLKPHFRDCQYGRQSVCQAKFATVAKRHGAHGLSGPSVSTKRNVVIRQRRGGVLQRGNATTC